MSTLQQGGIIVVNRVTCIEEFGPDGVGDVVPPEDPYGAGEPLDAESTEDVPPVE